MTPSKSNFKRVGLYLLKYKAKTYYFSSRINGKQYKRALESAEHKSAQDEAFAVRAQLIDEAKWPTTVSTCGEALQQWWWGPIDVRPVKKKYESSDNYKKSEMDQGLKQSTKDTYSDYRALLLKNWPDFEKTPLNKVCPQDIYKFRISLNIFEYVRHNTTTKIKGISARRHNKILDILKKIFRKASDLRLCDPELLDCLKKQKTKSQSRPLLTKEEFIRFLAKTLKDPSPGARMVEFMALTGARIGELEHLTWRWVVFLAPMTGNVRLVETKTAVTESYR